MLVRNPRVCQGGGAEGRRVNQRRRGPVRGLGSLEGKLGAGRAAQVSPQPPAAEPRRGPKVSYSAPFDSPTSSLDLGARPIKGTGKGLQDTLAVPHSRLRAARCLG